MKDVEGPHGSIVPPVPGESVVPPVPDSPPQWRAAGLGRRIGAGFIDSFIVGIPAWILAAIIPAIPWGEALHNVVVTMAYFAYCVLLEAGSGATIGKRWLGIHVAGADGALPTGRGPVSTEAAVKRNAWVLIGLLSAVPGLHLLEPLASIAIMIAIAATISSDPHGRGLHDKYAGTVVLRR